MRASPGQNLLEAIIAIGVILSAVVGSSALIVSTITAGRVSQTRTEAANFAREGIEIVRSLRDTNWLRFEQNELVGGAIPAWNTGLGNGTYILKMVPPVSGTGIGNWTLESCAGAPGCTSNRTSIYKTTNAANGNRIMFNQYLTQGECTTANAPACTPTKYSRLITLTLTTDDLGNGVADPNVDYVLVQSRVSWTARTQPTTLVAQVRLYDWK